MQNLDADLVVGAACGDREDWESCQSFVEAVAEAAEDTEALRGKKSEAAVALALANLKAAEL